MNISALLKAKKFQAVADALKGKSDSTSRIQRATALCYLQGEDEAAGLIADLPFEGTAAEIHSLLARFFASRVDLKGRLNIPDSDGKKWAKHYAEHPDFKVTNKLTAALIVKNEAAHIERCLRSVSQIADEIVVVDTGSTDGTIEIIKGLGLNVKLGSFEWCDDFAAARNAALDLATGDWALWIDADEELEADGHAEIRQGLIRPQFGGYFLRLINFTGEEGDNSTYTHTAMRLFRLSPSVRFEGRIHEQVVDIDPTHDFPNGNLGSATIKHYGYRPSEMATKGKYERFLTMLEREVRDNPQNAFHWFNLANAYTVCSKLTEATHAARHAVSLSENSVPYLSVAYQLLSNALTHTGKPQAALDALDEADERGLNGILTEFERANALMIIGQLEPALAAIDRSLTHGWEQHEIGDYSLFQYKRHVVRGQILALVGRLDEAVEMFDYAIKQSPTYINAYYLKGATLDKLGRYPEAIDCFNRVADDPTLTHLALSGIGRANAALGEHKLAAEAFEKAWILSPSDYDAWAAWAEACEASHDLETVVRAYSAFAKTNEPTPEILINWGRALDRAGQSQRALDCFAEALQRAPDDPNAYFNCGDLLYRFGLHQDAAHLYEGGLRLKPEFAPGWFMLGNCLTQMSLIDGARIAYNEALRVEPGYSDAATNLAALEQPVAA